MLTVVILYPQNKVSAGVADRFHWYARILLDWCLGEQLPCRTGGKTTGEINSKHWTIYPFIDLFLELMYPVYHWASDGLCWENNSWLLWAALLWCNWVWCNRVLKFSLTWDLVLQFDERYFALGCDPHSTRPVWIFQLPVCCPVDKLDVRPKYNS